MKHEMLASQTYNCHCVGCDELITERFLLSVAGQSWHVNCLRCAQCQRVMTRKCFVRNGKLYCLEHFMPGYLTTGRVCFDQDVVLRHQYSAMGLSEKQMMSIHDNRKIETACARTSVGEPHSGNPSSSNDDASTTSLTSWSHDDEDYDRGSASRCYDNGCRGNNRTMEPRSQCTISTNAMPQTTAAAAAEDDDSLLDERRVFNHVIDEWCDLQNVDVTAQGTVANETSSDKCDTSHEVTRSSSKTDGGLSVDQANAIGDDDPIVNEDDSTNNSGHVPCSRQREPRTTISGPQLSALLAAFAETPKPSRQAREQMAAQTGLSMRVIQVWFQNRRSKERRMRLLTVSPMTRRSTVVMCSAAVLHPLQHAGISINTPLSSSAVDLSNAAAAVCSSSSTLFDDGEQNRTHTIIKDSSCVLRRRHDADETELDEKRHDYGGSGQVGVLMSSNVVESWRLPEDEMSSRSFMASSTLSVYPTTGNSASNDIPRFRALRFTPCFDEITRFARHPHVL